MTTGTTNFYDSFIEGQREKKQRQDRALEIVERVAGDILDTSKLSYEVSIQRSLFEGDGILLRIIYGEYDWARLFNTEEVLLSDGEQMIKYYIISAVRQLGEAVFLKPGAIDKK